ncbi:MAG: M1 family metallopeptidase [Bacteroidota bacterium]
MRLSAIVLLICTSLSLAAQPTKEFTRYDYLHGKLTSLRTCYDVKHYEVHVKVEPDKRYISGYNQILFLATADFQKMQIDLFSEMHIDSVFLGNLKLDYLRDSNNVFINTRVKVSKNRLGKLRIYFSGKPREAKRPPWDGGFVWQQDTAGYAWVGMACEGIGASMWLPCKDHWSDEPDSADVFLTVPKPLTGVSNGKLITMQDVDEKFQLFHWRVSNPINLYGISINVGKYALIKDEFTPRIHEASKPLSLNYYVLEYNEERARKHFQQVQVMLGCFERYVGLYPFWDDGYKLVETPYWGMEHQSCVAYGNNYQFNRYNFDFILIHESAHEWFANSLTAADPAEMWIHESFTTYAEALYVECTQGKEASLHYLKDQKRNIENNQAMVGKPDVFFHAWKDNDIYYKGSWMLHTLRTMLDNDTLFIHTLNDFVKTFEHKIITTSDVIRFWSKRTGRNLRPFFAHYLYRADLPELEYQLKTTGDGNIVVRYRWTNTAKNFDMPIRVTMTKDRWDWVTPLRNWQVIDLNFFNPSEFQVDTQHFLIKLKETK